MRSRDCRVMLTLVLCWGVAAPADAGPPEGNNANVCAQWLPLAQRVEQVCASDAAQACDIDLTAFAEGCADPDNLDQSQFYTNQLRTASCAACAPAFVERVVLNSTLTVALEQVDDGAGHRNIQVVATLEVRSRGKVKQFILTPQVFADAAFDFDSSNVACDDFDGEGAQIVDWFPVPDQSCIFDHIDFVGMLIPQPASIEQDLVSIARRAFPNEFAGLEVVPVLVGEDGRQLEVEQLEDPKLEKSVANGVDGRTTRIARYAIPIRFAHAR